MSVLPLAWCWLCPGLAGAVGQADGRPVMAWVLPTSGSGHLVEHAQKPVALRPKPARAAPSKRSGVLPQVATEVTDVQAREVH